MNNKRNAVCMDMVDFKGAFEEWEKKKEQSVSDLKLIASKLYNLGVSEKQIAQVVSDVFRTFNLGGDDETEQ